MTRRRTDKSLYKLKKYPTQSRSKATVDAVLSAAVRILLSDGYDNASTNKIAHLAGVSVGSLYEYFPGKEAIFAEVRRREDRRLYELTMDGPEPPTVKELVRRSVAIYIKFVRSNLALHAALINEVPQFALEQEDYAVYSMFLPWAAEFLKQHEEELRHFENFPEMVEFVVRATRSTVDNYVLYAPERVNEDGVQKLLVDFVERFLFEQA